MRLIIKIFIILFLAWPFTPISHAAGIYKWVDDHGKVHYGDKSHTEAAEEIDIRVHTPRTPTPKELQRRARQRRLLDVFQEEREAARAQALRDNQRVARAQRNCNLARDRLRNLRQAAYLYDLDKKGNRVILPEKEREKALITAQADIDRWCK